MRQLFEKAKQRKGHFYLHPITRAWHELHFFPGFAPIVRFPGLGTSSMFFPRLGISVRAISTYIHLPALGTSCMFFARLESVACFPALGTSCLFSGAWRQLHVFPRFSLPTSHMFLLRVLIFVIGRLRCFNQSNLRL